MEARTIAVQIPSSLFDRVDEECKKQYISKNNLVRVLLDKWVKGEVSIRE